MATGYTGHRSGRMLVVRRIALSVRIYYSTSLCELAGKLADNLAGDRMGTPDPDPFVPAPVMVPNVNLKQWLQATANVFATRSPAPLVSLAPC